ncbi:MAG TPA: alpha/beta hydrolase [Terriglobales bacterium]|nr:alpha/beta hydrolase [Terriglobales bacterium]
MRMERLRFGHLECLRAGPERGEPGPPLLLVHGLGGGIWGWEYFQRHFAQRGFASYALELPGHGEDPDPVTARKMGQYSVETYALWVAAAMAQIGPCVVVGHSMGGLVAQKLAESHAQAGFVFLASAPPWHMFRRAYAPMWRHLLRHPWRELLLPLAGHTLVLDNTLQDALVNHRLPPDLRQEIARRDVPDSGRASMQMVAGLVSVDARRVTSPCLVAGGLDDRLIPASEQRRLAEFYQCPLQLHDRGHMLMLEPGWEEVADGILAWVASLQSGRADLAATG